MTSEAKLPELIEFMERVVSTFWMNGGLSVRGAILNAHGLKGQMRPQDKFRWLIKALPEAHDVMTEAKIITSWDQGIREEFNLQQHYVTPQEVDDFLVGDEVLDKLRLLFPEIMAHMESAERTRMSYGT